MLFAVVLLGSDPPSSHLLQHRACLFLRLSSLCLQQVELASQSTYIYRVLQCMSPRRNWDSPNASPACGGGGRGGVEVPIPTTEKKVSTLPTLCLGLPLQVDRRRALSVIRQYLKSGDFSYISFTTQRNASYTQTHTSLFVTSSSQCNFYSFPLYNTLCRQSPLASEKESIEWD